MTESLEQMLTKHGYTELRDINGMTCGLCRFIYTVGVCYGLDDTGYVGRYCFESAGYASLFLRDWDGLTTPEVGIDGCTAIK